MQQYLHFGMSKQFYDYYRPDTPDGQGDSPLQQRRTVGFEGNKPKKRADRASEFQPQPRHAGFRSAQPDFLAKMSGKDMKRARPPQANGASSEESLHERPKNPKKRWLKRIGWTFFVLLFVALLGVGWVSSKFLNETTKVFGGTSFGNAVKLLQPTKLAGEARGHVNILVAGNSVDDPGHGGADLTDSILLLSLDTDNNKAYMFSIPRDLWVNIPGEGYHKINEAYRWGKVGDFQEAGFPAGGMGLLEKTIEERFAVPIDYYALVNYTALKNIVNAIGGVDITIQSTDPRGLYDPNINYTDGGPLKLPNGVNHLDGQTALNLSRARGDPTNDGRVGYGFARSDFDRTEHQRQLLTAIQAKMSSTGTLINPFKLGKVLDGIGTNITTDLQINEARRLVGFVRKIGTNNLQSLGLASDKKNYLRSYSSPTGQSALVPAAGVNDYSDIQAYIQPLLGSL